MKVARQNPQASKPRPSASFWVKSAVRPLVAGLAFTLGARLAEVRVAQAQVRPIDRTPPDQKLPRTWEKLPRPLAGVLFEQLGKGSDGNILSELKSEWSAWPLKPTELEAALFEQKLLTEALIALESCPLFSAVDLLPRELCMLMEDPSIEPTQSIPPGQPTESVKPGQSIEPSPAPAPKKKRKTFNENKTPL